MTRRLMKRRKAPPEPVLELTHWVPGGSTVIGPDGRSYITTTPMGTRIAWSTCGRCGVHVLHCLCAGSRAPRSVTYIWHQDLARSRGESWTPEHRDYRREFESHEIKPPRRKLKRLRR